MRKMESLKIIKIMCHIGTLRSFNIFNGQFDSSIIYASCYGDYDRSIVVYYDTVKKTYHLSVDSNSAVYKSFAFIFTQEFSQQVFEAIQTIYLRKECEKND